MICTTVRNGSECAFMTAKGCGFNGGACHQTVEQCSGCDRTIQVDSAWYCNAFPEPAKKWKNGSCNFATHTDATAGQAQSAKINPLKASKRSKR